MAVFVYVVGPNIYQRAATALRAQSPTIPKTDYAALSDKLVRTNNDLAAAHANVERHQQVIRNLQSQLNAESHKNAQSTAAETEMVERYIQLRETPNNGGRRRFADRGIILLDRRTR
jgi:hypothetical protein